jgi:hypothetical protein
MAQDIHAGMQQQMPFLHRNPNWQLQNCLFLTEQEYDSLALL